MSPLKRADLLQVLYQTAKPFVNVIQDRVTSLSTTPSGSPYITTETGRVIHADLVLGADGIKSIVRPFVTTRRTAQSLLETWHIEL